MPQALSLFIPLHVNTVMTVKYDSVSETICLKLMKTTLQAFTSV